MVSPISYSPSTIMEKPAIKSVAKSLKAKPIIAVPIPKPAKIDLTLTPYTDKIDKTTRTTIIYLIILINNVLNVFILCF